MSSTPPPHAPRIVRHDAGQDRTNARNRETMFPFTLRAGPRLPKELLFPMALPGIRELAATASSTKLVVAVVDATTGVPIGRAIVDARPGLPTPLVLGRHGSAHLQLPDRDDTPLRHLLVLVHPLRELDPDALTFSVRDLRTADGGFSDEHGAKHEAVIARGPLMIYAGHYAVFFVPVDERTELPIGQQAARDWFPPPSIVADAEPTRCGANDVALPSRKRRSYVTIVPGLVGEGSVFREVREPLMAELRFGRGAAKPALGIGGRALRRGVLLGNYGRCDTGPMDGTVSRVHALIIEIEGSICLVDLSSTNGTHAVLAQGTQRIAIETLRSGASFRLGCELLVEWRTID